MSSGRRQKTSPSRLFVYGVLNILALCGLSLAVTYKHHQVHAASAASATPTAAAAQASGPAPAKLPAALVAAAEVLLLGDTAALLVLTRQRRVAPSAAPAHIRELPEWDMRRIEAEGYVPLPARLTRPTTLSWQVAGRRA
jgi:hypothetical protein